MDNACMVESPAFIHLSPSAPSQSQESHPRAGELGISQRPPCPAALGFPTFCLIKSGSSRHPGMPLPMTHSASGAAWLPREQECGRGGHTESDLGEQEGAGRVCPAVGRAGARGSASLPLASSQTPQLAYLGVRAELMKPSPKSGKLRTGEGGYPRLAALCAPWHVQSGPWGSEQQHPQT